jgi:hypothetical protein
MTAAAAIQCGGGGGRWAHGSNKFPRHDNHDAQPTSRHAHSQRHFTLHTSSWITLERLRRSERASRTSTAAGTRIWPCAAHDVLTRPSQCFLHPLGGQDAAVCQGAGWPGRGQGAIPRARGACLHRCPRARLQGLLNAALIPCDRHSSLRTTSNSRSASMP